MSLYIWRSSNKHCPDLPHFIHWFFLYPLKTSENPWFSDIFRGYRKKPVVWNGVIYLFSVLVKCLLISSSYLYGFPTSTTCSMPNINPFQVNVPFLHPLKTSENRRFSDVFRGYRKGTLAWNELSSHFTWLPATIALY